MCPTFTRAKQKIATLITFGLPNYNIERDEAHSRVRIALLRMKKNRKKSD